MTPTAAKHPMKQSPWRGQRRSLRRVARRDGLRHRWLTPPGERNSSRIAALRRGEARRRRRQPRFAAYRSFRPRAAVLVPRRNER